MKILFVITDFYPNIGATANCVMNLCKFFSSENISVQVLCLKQNPKEKSEEDFNGIIIHRLQCAARLTKKGIMDLLMKHPFICIFLIINKIINNIIYSKGKINRSIIQKLQKNIEKLNKQYNYDCVIAVSANIEPAIATISIKDKLKRIGFYQVDPYTSNKILDIKKRDSRFLLEKRIYNEFDFVITTPIIYLENNKNMSLKSQIIACEFPNIIERDRTKKLVLEGDGIQCLFAGYISKQVRNPSYFIKLIEAAGRSNIKINFHFFCFGELKELTEISNRCSNVYIHEKQNSERIFEYFNAADILVNIGNNMTNQVPSKIFDYISTGKPIVNLYKSEQCPSIKYLSRYPAVFNINENISVNQVLNPFLNFCKNNVGTQIEFEIISDLYKENTVANVGNKFIKIIRGENNGE